MTPCVEMKNIRKRYGGVEALKSVDFSIMPGEIRGLVGENGAGKSTLMKILSGAVRKDSGTILMSGKEVDIHSPISSRNHGIGIIYQEFALAPDLTVSENVYLSRLPQTPVLNWKKLVADTRELMDRLGFSINPLARVGSLSVAYQQVVEIAKALSEKVKVLILDEPSAVLAPADLEQLFQILKTLKEHGVSIVYISHRLEEIFAITDRVTAMKDGAVTAEFVTAETNQDALIAAMIGRELTSLFPKRNATIGDVALKVEDLANDKVAGVSLEVRAGEVLGLAGLVGSGRTEIARAVFAEDPRTEGKIWVKGKEIHPYHPRDAVRAGIGLVPEDRKSHGALLSMSIRENATMATLRKVSGPLGVIKRKSERSVVRDLITRLTIKTDNMDNPVSSLSGGNQQKVVLAKWLAAKFTVMILDEPTRGVDVGAKYEIYELINELAESGLAVLMISSELTELIGMCDRVLVIRDGAVSGELTGADITEENMMRYAIRSSSVANPA
ncbi:MAG: sugar ABC transporter ATP-binding protein [Planctomycetes bacterium]|nr:sugar ABC transporter ATP-binding protein [Planctomycetota bacterium]